MKTKNNIQFSILDIIIAIISFLLLIYSWAYVIVEYPNLPDTIAVHFDAQGVPNGYNDKYTIWLAPVIFTALSISMLLGAKKPVNFFKYTLKNYTSKEILANSKILLFSSLLLSILLLTIVTSMIKTSINSAFSTSWILPFSVGVIGIYLGTLFYYYLQTLKK